jgi:hypothetical protein
MTFLQIKAGPALELAGPSIKTGREKMLQPHDQRAVEL